MRYARSGADIAADLSGSVSAWLPALEARAWALMSTPDEATNALGRAADRRADHQPDDLDRIGGLLTFPQAKQDYCIRVEGPLVRLIRQFVLQQLGSRPSELQQRPLPRGGTARAMFVARDNHNQRDAIERQYRAAIHAARREVVIANAYFFPGYRLLRAMRRAVQRGVRVRLVLQGQPDMKIVKHAAELLHGQLIRAGVEIYEYCKRPLHAKVAVVDDEWSTVGSSNLDPLSLSLNLEANVMIRDQAFAADVRERLDRLMREDCRQLEKDEVAARHAGWRLLLDTLAYHVTRRFPRWAGLLPAHAARLKPLAPPQPHQRDETAWGQR